MENQQRLHGRSQYKLKYLNKYTQNISCIYENSNDNREDCSNRKSADQFTFIHLVLCLVSGHKKRITDCLL